MLRSRKSRRRVSRLVLEAHEDRIVPATFVEPEADGTASNNTGASATLLPAAFFTLPAPANVAVSAPTASVQGRGSNDDADFYRLNLLAGTQLTLDVDDDPSTFDTILT